MGFFDSDETRIKKKLAGEEAERSKIATVAAPKMYDKWIECKLTKKYEDSLSGFNDWMASMTGTPDIFEFMDPPSEMSKRELMKCIETGILLYKRRDAGITLVKK